MVDTATHPPRTLASGMTFLLALASGLIVANLYYAQPLAGLISASLGMSESLTGLIVTLTQIGYGVGLIFLVPLGDLVENRFLVVVLILLSGLAAAGAALAGDSVTFFVAAAAIGLTSVGVQVIIPFAAHLAPDATRGRAVGNVMAGLMIGIMLARPVSSMIASVASWHLVFALSAAAMLALAVLLRFTLPARQPHSHLPYGALIASLGKLLADTPILRRRSFYQACMFAAFSVFWTVTPLYLTGPAFGLTQQGVALFALVGVAGAVASPIAGRLADAGWTRPGTGLALVGASLAFASTHLAAPGSKPALGLLTLAAVLLDYSVMTCMVLGQRALFALSAEQRSRINGIYMALLFAGGAVGSALGGFAYARGGWPLASAIGGIFPLVALGWFATEAFRRDRRHG